MKPYPQAVNLYGEPVPVPSHPLKRASRAFWRGVWHMLTETGKYGFFPQFWH